MSPKRIVTVEEDRETAFTLANFMSRHIVGKQFAASDETCRICIDYALTVIAKVRASEVTDPGSYVAVPRELLARLCRTGDTMRTLQAIEEIRELLTPEAPNV